MSGYRLDSGLTLEGIHPDAVREALAVFEYYGGSTGPKPEEAMARALAAAQEWQRHYDSEEAASERRARERADLDVAMHRAAVRVTVSHSKR